MSKFVRKYGAAGAALLASTAAMAQSDPTFTSYDTAGEALQALAGATDGFGPVLFGLAVVSSVILIGVAWIKKGRGAAK